MQASRGARTIRSRVTRRRSQSDVAANLREHQHIEQGLISSVPARAPCCADRRRRAMQHRSNPMMYVPQYGSRWIASRHFGDVRILTYRGKKSFRMSLKAGFNSLLPSQTECPASENGASDPP